MNKNLTRRKMLKTSTAALGAVAGAGLLKGFPAIHAADAPVIRYLGTAVNMGDAVQKKLFDDTGIKVKFIVKTTDEVVKQFLHNQIVSILLILNILVCLN